MQVDGIERVLISVAFVSSAGVKLVGGHVRPHAANATVFVGIRNGITSAQAIKELLDLGVRLWMVDTGSASLVFHPKIYYAQGTKTARLMVGSANLTTGGLNNNIEASVILDLNLAARDDKRIARFIEHLFKDLPAKHPSNISAVAQATSLETLLADPRLVDERSVSVRTVSRLIGGAGALNPVPILKVLTKRIVSHLPQRLLSPRRANAPASPTPSLPLVTAYELVWTTTKLTERDLNIPKGETTNATGSMNLDKGAMDDGFNFQDYFRNEVFNHLPWDPPDARGIERARANFHLIVEGIDCGSFDLTVRHDTKTGTKSEAQGQPRTKLSWGKAKPFVAKDALIGRTLSLSRSIDDRTRFLIAID
jgi:HKD family nuclease